MAEHPSEHSHNPDVTIPGCPGCAAAIAEMSPVERAMRDLRQAANKFRAAWDWHMDCVRMLGRHEVVQQSEDRAHAADRELGEAAQRYAGILAMAAPTTAATDLTVDQIANWASGRPANPTTAHGVYMAMEIQRHRAARYASAERVRDVVRAACSIVSDRSGAGFAERHIEDIATRVAEKLAPPASGTVLDANTRDVIMAIINFQSHAGKWVEAAALRTLLSIVDRSPDPNSLDVRDISARISRLTHAAGMATVPDIWRELCAIDGALRVRLSAQELQSRPVAARCDECDPSFSCFTAPEQCRKRPRSGS